MEVSFSKNPESPVIEVQTVTTPVEGVTVDSVNTHTPTTTAVVTREAMPVANAADGLLIGDSFPTFDQIILPRINMVQGSGQLKDSFPFGSLVFNQSVVLYAPPVPANSKTNQPAQPGTPPVAITVLHVRPTRFAEKAPWPQKGLICNTEAEVAAAGGTLSFQEHKLKEASGIKLFEYMADTVVAIEKPDHIADDDTIFCYPVDGKKYTIGLWNFKATAYVAACKRVIFYARRMSVCINGYPTHSFSASTRVEPGKGNSYIVPVLLPRAKSTPAFLDFARSILNPQ